MSIEGNTAVFLGSDDLHDTNHEHLELRATVPDILKSSKIVFSDNFVPLDEDFCPYTLHIYPTDQLYDKHVTNAPIVLAVLVSAFFVLVVMILVSYDIVVKRRLRRIEKVAKESGGLVCELYPEQVRDRMLERLRSNPDVMLMTPTNSQLSSVDMLKRVVENSRATVAIRNLIRAERERVWRRERQQQNNNSPLSSSSSPVIAAVEADVTIADSFPDCTIMFSYLHGFNDWCEKHDPHDIFILLERVFGCLDAIAKRHKVFKINTILDSYFAATGLPRPQPDHAMRMGRFARVILGAIQGLLSRELSDLFGPETADMQLRVGLHSGRVTAGLLAGDKVRFDVFGDTVNTASRMGTNGAPGCIHVSPTTADLIKEAGKSRWLGMREDRVTLKGKGEMETYWLRPRSADLLQYGSSSFSLTTCSDTGSAEIQTTDGITPPSPMPSIPHSGPGYSLFDLRPYGDDMRMEEEEEIVFVSDSEPTE